MLIFVKSQDRESFFFFFFYIFFLLAIRTFDINSFTNFPIYNTGLITTVTRLYITSPGLTVKLKFVPFGFFHPFCSPSPQPLETLPISPFSAEQKENTQVGTTNSEADAESGFHSAFTVQLFPVVNRNSSPTVWGQLAKSFWNSKRILFLSSQPFFFCLLKN